MTLNEKREAVGFAPVPGGDRVTLRRGERAMADSGPRDEA